MFPFGQIYTHKILATFYLLTHVICNFGSVFYSITLIVMKNRGSVFEYARERDDDIMRAYIEQIDSCDQIHLPKVFSRVVNMPSKRFWVSPERASIVISNMMRGDNLASMRPTKREMFFEIYKRVLELKALYPKKTIYQLTCIVVQQEAPKFYLTAGSAKVIICKIKKKWYAKRMQRLRRLHCRQE